MSWTSVVPESWELPKQITDRFGDTAGKQRAMYAQGHLLLVLHEPPGPDDRDRKARLLWRDPQGRWSCNCDGSVESLPKKHVMLYSLRAEHWETELQRAEHASDYFALLQAVAPLHRASRNMHAAWQEARQLVSDDHEIIVARDMAADVERAFELLQEDAKNGLEFMVAKKAELQSERSFEMAVSAHRLNILAALFFPISAISAVFSMRFRCGLEPVAEPWLFWAILALEVFAGLVLAAMTARNGKAESMLNDKDRHATTIGGKQKSSSTRSVNWGL